MTAKQAAKPAAPPAAQVPKNWPAHLTYLTRPVYSHITPAQRRQLQTQAAAAGAGPALSEVPSILGFGPSALVEIRRITDAAHPACGQHGLFAARALRPGSFIVPYLGEYHRGNGGARRAMSDYDLWLDRDADVAVDADRAGNEARFVNDYRGVAGAARPNAEFREVWDPRRGERAMAVFAVPAGKKRGGSGSGGGGDGIAKGDEILVSYGKGFWDVRRERQDKQREVDEKKKRLAQPGAQAEDELVELVDRLDLSAASGSGSNTAASLAPPKSIGSAGPKDGIPARKGIRTGTGNNSNKHPAKTGRPSPSRSTWAGRANN